MPEALKSVSVLGHLKEALGEKAFANWVPQKT
jgi:hypothetical protein